MIPISTRSAGKVSAYVTKSDLIPISGPLHVSKIVFANRVYVRIPPGATIDDAPFVTVNRDPHVWHADAREGNRSDAQKTAVKTACLAVDDLMGGMGEN